MRKLIERIKQIKSIDFKAKYGFSLMEMMIVLLIVAIIAAATAPVVSKKMTKNMGTNDSPWVFTNTNGTVAYNPSGNANATAIIGAANVPDGLHTRLFIDCGDANHSHIAFGRGDSTPMQITADPQGGRVGISNANIPNNTVAFGTGQTIDVNGTNSVVIGSSAQVTGSGSIAIGNNAESSGQNHIAIGPGAQASYRANNMGLPNLDPLLDVVNAQVGNVAIGRSCLATGRDAVAIGNNVTATDSEAVAIGGSADATGVNSVAIGLNANASATQSVAIGTGAVADHNNQITLGSDVSTVYIPGTLIIGKKSYFGTDLNERTIWGKFNSNKSGFLYDGGGADRVKIADSSYTTDGLLSDRRLKNVGEKYTAGLEELKKLEFFHYTFKKDKDKTPHVGVMAQDLQEVFPDAVTLGHDGYLRIRMEDMFYAVINAVKELDLKLSEAVESIKSAVEEISGLKTTVEVQEKTIEELQKTNEKQQQLIEALEKRINKLEKSSKK